MWRCTGCRRQFSALTATALHGTRLDVRSWLAATALADELGRAPSAPELCSALPVTREAAGRMARVLTAAAVAAASAQGSATADGPTARPALEVLLGLSRTEVDRVRRSGRARVRPSGLMGPTADLC